MERVASALVAAALLAGCGTSDDRDQARTVVERFYAAVRDDRGDAACDLLSEPAAEQIESQSGQPCRAVVTRLDLEGGPAEVVDVHVAATQAKVELRNGETAFLNRRSDGWRLVGVACRPEEGKPRDRPFDCEVDA
jgi:hypothetical protein